MVRPINRIANSLSLAFGIFLLFFVVRSTLACTCSPPDPINEVLASSDAVVTAKLTKAFRDTAILTVEKVYKGDLKTSEEIELWNGSGGNCIFYFRAEDVGSSFLLFMSRPTAEYPSLRDSPLIVAKALRSASHCSRSKRVSDASADLSFLNKYEELKDKTRVSGRFIQGLDARPFVTKIKISGERKSIELTVDKAGYFETYDLPAGRFVVEFETEPGWALEEWVWDRASNRVGRRTSANGKHSVPIDLAPADHIELQLYFVPTGGIRGRVISPTGEPMKGAQVCAVVVLNDADYCSTERTNELGEFEINRLRPYKYYLVVNQFGRISVEQPFRRSYYPSTSLKADAKHIDVKLNVVNDILVQIPEVVELIDVRGKVVLSDGTPARAQYVKFQPASNEFDQVSGSAEDGTFSLRVPSTAKGSIFAEIQLSRREEQNCPERLKLFDGKSDNWISVRSNEIVFSPESAKGLLLKFPVPGCKPSQKE